MAETKTTEQRVKAIIINKLGAAETEITNETHLGDDLFADSLDHVELIMEIEQEFSISIPDSDVDKINTFGDIIGYLKEKHNIV